MVEDAWIGIDEGGDVRGHLGAPVKCIGVPVVLCEALGVETASGLYAPFGVPESWGGVEDDFGRFAVVAA